jgi:NADH dehydrogenase FAD-containing subunit
VGALLATASVLAQPVRPLPFLITTQSDALLPKAAGKRVVICGGGWGGVSAARHLKKNNPAIEVVLLERNPLFFSCPMSSKWLVDVVDTNYLTWSYLDVASKYDYRFIQTEVLAFERDRKRVITARAMSIMTT